MSQTNKCNAQKVVKSLSLPRDLRIGGLGDSGTPLRRFSPLSRWMLAGHQEPLHDPRVRAFFLSRAQYRSSCVFVDELGEDTAPLTFFMLQQAKGCLRDTGMFDCCIRPLEPCIPRSYTSIKEGTYQEDVVGTSPPSLV